MSALALIFLYQYHNFFAGGYMDVYNKNRDHNNSLSDEIREQNAKLKGAPLKDKLLYFKDYYLLTTLGIIVAFAFLSALIYSMVTAPDDTAIGIFLYNDTGDSSNTELIDSFAQYMGIDTSKHNAYLDASMTYSPGMGDYDAYVGLEKAMATITAKELDIIVGDSNTIDYFAKCGLLADITAVLPEDLLEEYQDCLYYAKIGSDDELTPVGIFVSDAPKLNKYHYYDDKEPVFSFIVNSENLDTAMEFLRYLYRE